VAAEAFFCLTKRHAVSDAASAFLSKGAGRSELGPDGLAGGFRIKKKGFWEILRDLNADGLQKPSPEDSLRKACLSANRRRLPSEGMGLKRGSGDACGDGSKEGEGGFASLCGKGAFGGMEFEPKAGKRKGLKKAFVPSGLKEDPALDEKGRPPVVRHLLFGDAMDCDGMDGDPDEDDGSMMVFDFAACRNQKLREVKMEARRDYWIFCDEGFDGKSRGLRERGSACGQADPNDSGEAFGNGPGMGSFVRGAVPGLRLLGSVLDRESPGKPRACDADSGQHGLIPGEGLGPDGSESERAFGGKLLEFSDKGKAIGSGTDGCRHPGPGEEDFSKIRLVGNYFEGSADPSMATGQASDCGFGLDRQNGGMKRVFEGRLAEILENLLPRDARPGCFWYSDMEEEDGPPDDVA
jgi:hypothetical protein